MTTTQIAMISIIVIALIALAVVLYLYNRTKKLRAQFGPEYNRAVEEAGSRYKAEETQGRRDTRPKRHLRSVNLGIILSVHYRPADRVRFNSLGGRFRRHSSTIPLVRYRMLISF